MQQNPLLTRAAKKQGEQKKRLTEFIRPQYVTEPQNIEGNVQGVSTANQESDT